jgi:iron-sulfur cluster assembly accessory protein
METSTLSQTPATTVPSAEAAPQLPVRLSEAAVTQVKEVIKAQGFEGYAFSIRVVPAGCSGLGYDLNLVKELKPNDQVWEQDGVRIATDALSSKYLEGTVVDYVTSVTGAGFKFINPNAKSSCGCGTSFTT